ncbi:MAG: polysaccharide biosynthesis tyrosine autokinase [bacterium]|nr:polysaccharide biosynthesis tyrosine autokinase [bacterium]
MPPANRFYNLREIPRPEGSPQAAERPSGRAYPPAAEERLTLRDYLAVLRRRRWTLVVTLLAVVVSAIVLTFRQEPLYRATLSLIMEPDNPEIGSFARETPVALYQEFYQTQYEVLRSNAVLAKAFDACGLESDPAFSGSAAPLDVLRSRLFVDPVPNSRLVRLSIDHGERDTAIEIADTLARVFIEHHQSDRRTAASNAFVWLSKQIDALKTKVEDSEWALLDYKGQEDVVSIQRRQELLEESLARLNERRDDDARETAELATVLREVARIRRNPEMVDSLPQLLDNPLAQKLKQDLGQLTVELAEVSLRFKPKHPEVISLESRIGTVKERLAAEVERIYRSVEIDHQIARAKLATIDRDLQTMKQQSVDVAEQAIEFRVLEREAESNRKVYDVLLERLHEADISGSISGHNIRVLDQATAPASPYKPRKKLNLLIALLTGLTLGIGLCFLHEHLDNTLKTDHDVVETTNLPALGLIPRQKGPIQLDDDNEELSRAYASLATSLRLHARDHVLQSLLLTSAVRGEGKTVSTAALGTALARGGFRTLLIDTDMFQTALGKLLGVDRRVGLSQILLDDTPFEEAVQKTRFEGLDIIPAGLIPPDPGGLLGSPKLLELIEQARQSYDWILLDSPPVSAALDVAFLNRAVDGVLVMVKASSTTRPQVRKVLGSLEATGGNLLGVVLTSAEISADSLDYHSYRYGYTGGEASSDQ